MNSSKYLYRIIAISLSLLMFVTSIHLTIDIHYCRGNILSVSFFGKAKSCNQLPEATLKNSCPHYKKMMAKKGGCPLVEKKNCNNKTFQIQLKQDQVYSPIIVDTDNQVLFESILSLIFIPKRTRFVGILPPFINYKPPILVKNIPVLVQSFIL